MALVVTSGRVVLILLARVCCKEDERAYCARMVVGMTVSTTEVVVYVSVYVVPDSVLNNKLARIL